MKILIVEDEPELAGTLSDFLKQEGYLVEQADNFPTADEKARLNAYDCLILDLNLPGGGSGLDVLRYLKKNRPETGVLIISARNALDARITGLDLGADDYLTKPFHLTELNARLKAILRRRNFGGSNDLIYREIRIALAERQLFVLDHPVELTPKEFNLLLYFLSNQNRVLSRESIAEHLHGDFAENMDDFNFIYSHIKNLRKKLVDHGCRDYLRAVYGIGYKFTDQKS